MDSARPQICFLPDFYQQKENVACQLGTYLLGNEAWEYGIVEIVRVPALRTGQGRLRIARALKMSETHVFSK